jgi:hypothetical protein
MKNELISLFIDDELSLAEKIELTRSIHAHRAVRDDAIALLEQEIGVRGDVALKVPAVEFDTEPWFRSFVTRTWGYLATAAATACIIFLLTFQGPPAQSQTVPYRFVLFNPDAKQVQLSGSFTDWEARRMNRIGDSGYWVVTLDVGRGEHRFTYLLNGVDSVADPSIPAREKDDFGGENSILHIGV